MIYVEEKSFERQLKLIKHLSEHCEFDLIAWLYQDSLKGEFCGLPILNQKEGEPVTTYGDGTIPDCTKRTLLSSSIIDCLVENKELIVQHCDSLVLYKVGEQNWYMATIGHEGMSLVRDDKLLTDLVLNNFNAKTKKPSWW